MCPVYTEKVPAAHVSCLLGMCQQNVGLRTAACKGDDSVLTCELRRAKTHRRGRNYCFVVTAITPPIFPLPYFVVASHERYRRIIVICEAGIERSELIGP